MDKKYFTYKVDENGEVSEAYGRFTPQEQLDAMNKKNKKRKVQDEFGAFIWLLFNNTEELFPGVSPANITRLIYVSTFLGYDGYLTNHHKPMTKAILQKKLKLSKNMFYSFWQEMTDNHIFEVKDDKIFLNDSLFRRGRISKKLDSDFTRICIKGIRYIYENCTDTKQHKTMSYLFKALPYVNKEWNIVSKNDINIKEIEAIEPMTVTEFGDLLGYDHTNSNKLIKKLCSIRIDDEGAFTICLNLNKAYMVINPRIYYSGKNWRNVQVFNKLT